MRICVCVCVCYTHIHIYNMYICICIYIYIIHIIPNTEPHGHSSALSQEDRKLSKAGLKRTIKKFLAGKLRVIGGNDAEDEEI
jgi:hypothetical protein